ncbi:hypothetical protein ABIA33_005291 [Streptacidiphilus sp. MAP12-16]|jgi:hypothetical protein|uniref:SCO5918 family protein n=1 Tax=Streptacidiphilus sp. MAP12-16 TaxID=3156300 RepID=UPI0035175A28
MRFTIAGCSFYLQASEVVALMKDVKAEPVTGESVRIGRRTYPIKQVGAIITKQDRRDFSAADVIRAMQNLGFTCNPAPAPAAPESAPVLEATDAEIWPATTPEQQ